MDITEDQAKVLEVLYKSDVMLSAEEICDKINPDVNGTAAVSSNQHPEAINVFPTIDELLSSKQVVEGKRKTEGRTIFVYGIKNKKYD
jgi:hypothetical protein